jgi:hypothetical protein
MIGEKRLDFLLDTNVFITPSTSFYPFDFTQVFWIFLSENIINGRVKVLRTVYEEICAYKSEDDVKRWIPQFKKYIYEVDEEISKNIKIVKNYIKESPLYSHDAEKRWDGNVADPWLIGASMAYGHMIVTFEVHNSPSDSPSGKSSNPKIPNIADHFNIFYISLFKMMRLLEFKF